jgi:uncharacterized protein DUF6812
MVNGVPIGFAAGALLCLLDGCPLRLVGRPADSAEVDRAELGQKERRVERVQMETDRQLITGDITLPPEGYQSRFSDALNRVDVTFIPLVNVEVSSLLGGEVERLPFMVVSKDHVRIAFPVGERT